MSERDARGPEEHEHSLLVDGVRQSQDQDAARGEKELASLGGRPQ